MSEEMPTEVKEMPEAKPSDLDTRACSNCIHFGSNVEKIPDIICSIARDYQMGKQQLHEAHGVIVDWEMVMLEPAVKCSEFIPKYNPNSTEYGV